MGPMFEFYKWEYPVNCTHHTFGPKRRRLFIHLIADNLLHEAVEGVSVILGYAVDEGVAHQGGEEGVERERVIGDVREGGGDVVAEFRSTIAEEFEGDEVGVEEGAQAEEVGGGGMILLDFGEVE